MRTYRVPRDQVRTMLRDVLSLPGIQLANKGVCLRALDLSGEHNLSFADACTAVYLTSHGLTEIYSWDTDFDRLEGIRRVEPAEPDEAGGSHARP